MLDGKDRDDELHQATGLGDYAKEPLTENAYIRARNKIGAADAPGELAGDDSMKQRKSYLGRWWDPRYWE